MLTTTITDDKQKIGGWIFLSLWIDSFKIEIAFFLYFSALLST